MKTMNHQQMVNLVGLDIDASTTKDFTEPEHSLLLLGSPFAWRFISSDGTLSNSMLGSSNSENRLPSEQLLPNNIGQGPRAHGIVSWTSLRRTAPYAIQKGPRTAGSIRSPDL
ncbi:hypothetical protein [Bifidobacterium choladohabitans]|uniref:hypothetical protein n=1 Tax=Bifidobacterium choladohabitans TaxID=2750947 RepID=UPI0018DDEFD7|nr:hypothetical protein [Bifidobacterium choladohabitans]MBI0048020.1 hypothetical protein [Bifidobacterium choladohabitans]MCT6836502.1 hypothetical protein [Bifidobacteriales bacterium]